MAKAEEPTQSVIKKPASEIDTASLNTALNEMSSVQFKDIDVTFFSHQSRKSTRLIGNTDENNSIKARRDWLSFDLRETLYISSIEVFAKGYKEYDEIELSYIDTFSKQEKRSVSKFKDDKALVEISSFIEGF